MIDSKDNNSKGETDEIRLKPDDPKPHRQGTHREPPPGGWASRPGRDFGTGEIYDGRLFYPD